MKKINKILISLAFSLSACFGLEEDTGSILTISQLRTEADFDAATGTYFCNYGYGQPKPAQEDNHGRSR